MLQGDPDVLRSRSRTDDDARDRGNARAMLCQRAASVAGDRTCNFLIATNSQRRIGQAVMTGNRRVKVDPCSGLLLAVSVAPIAVDNLRLIGKPRPVPSARMSCRRI